MAVIELLLLGVESDIEAELGRQYQEFLISRCDNKADMQSFFSGKNPRRFQMIACGSQFKDVSSAELAQTIRMIFPEAIFLYISNFNSKEDSKALIKNGFQDVFFLPNDRTNLVARFPKYVAAAEIAAHTSVPLIDIQPGLKIPFEFRMHIANQEKFVRYSSVGEVLKKENVDRLVAFRQSSLYVTKLQLPEFYEFSAKRLFELSGGPQGLVDPDQIQKLELSIAELIRNQLRGSPEKIKKGAGLSDHVTHIVEKFLMLKHPGDWLEKMRSEGSFRGEILKRHQRVLNLSVLFGACLHCPNLQELAIAGFLRDIGLSEIPQVLHDKPIEQMSQEDFALYKTHPKASVRMLKSKSLPYSGAIYEAIEFHHERWSGTGFPNRFRGARFSLTTQIVILANRFDELTRLESNAGPMTIDQALRQIDHEGCIGPEYLSTIKSIFSLIPSEG